MVHSLAAVQPYGPTAYVIRKLITWFALRAQPYELAHKPSCPCVCHMGHYVALHMYVYAHRVFNFVKPPLKCARTTPAARITFGYAHSTWIRTGGLDRRSSAGVCVRIMRRDLRTMWAPHTQGCVCMRSKIFARVRT